MRDAAIMQPAETPMILIRQPNRWSCNACAFAMVLGLTLEEIIQAVGHDGQENEGFDDTDLIWVAALSGRACTWLEVPPDMALNATGPAPDYLEELTAFMTGKHGVLSVMHPEIPEGLHAVAWDGARVFDPLLGHRPLAEYQLWGFHWMVKI